jgi:molecular chaperone GrpE
VTEEQEVKPDSEEQLQEEEQAEEVAVESQREPIPEEGEEPAVEGLEALRNELEQARAKEAEYLDGWQRARAELSNARKRFQREQQQSYTNAKADVLSRLLPIVDDLERAFETLPDDLSGHGWVEGIRLVQCKAQGLLEQEGVAPIDAVGREFDPFLHQAVTHEPSDQVPEGHVIAQMQRGYSLGDRVLRPCMVRVSAGPPARPEQAEEQGLEEQIPSAED